MMRNVFFRLGIAFGLGLELMAQGNGQHAAESEAGSKE